MDPGKLNQARIKECASGQHWFKLRLWMACDINLRPWTNNPLFRWHQSECQHLTWNSFPIGLRSSLCAIPIHLISVTSIAAGKPKGESTRGKKKTEKGWNIDAWQTFGSSKEHRAKSLAFRAPSGAAASVAGGGVSSGDGNNCEARDYIDRAGK